MGREEKKRVFEGVGNFVVTVECTQTKVWGNGIKTWVVLDLDYHKILKFELQKKKSK